MFNIDIMKKKIYISAWILIMLIPGFLLAQRGYKSNNRKEVIINRRTLSRDIDELNIFNRDLASYRRAIRHGEPRRANRIMQDLLADMHREISQSEHKVRIAQRELRNTRSRSQVRRRPSGAYERRYTNRTRDDRWDLGEAIDRLSLQKDIYRSVVSTTPGKGRNRGKRSGRYNGRNRVRIVDDFIAFQRTMENDIYASKRELQEDRYESRNW